MNGKSEHQRAQQHLRPFRQCIPAVDETFVGLAPRQRVDNDHAGRVLLDFTPVHHLSSQAIGIIVNVHKKTAAKKGGKLVLCGVCPQMLQLLKITRLDKLLKMVKDQKEATGV